MFTLHVFEEIHDLPWLLRPASVPWFVERPTFLPRPALFRQAIPYILTQLEEFRHSVSPFCIAQSTVVIGNEVLGQRAQGVVASKARQTR